MFADDILPTIAELTGVDIPADYELNGKNRIVYAEVPPRVKFELTKEGNPSRAHLETKPPS